MKRLKEISCDLLFMFFLLPIASFILIPITIIIAGLMIILIPFEWLFYRKHRLEGKYYPLMTIVRRPENKEKL